ncbi:alpha/beta hydrolase [Novosphingobium sp. BW1]|nr:alpha/beta hydrolase [Novosphingobium sp. BW1]
MMRMARPLLALGSALALSATGALSASAAPDYPGDDTLRAGYALPNSQFATIEGEPVHFVDEGKGPAILLVHGSFASLRQWDNWAAELTKSYRVIRYDKAPAGLSGPNPQGDYSTKHQIQLIDALMTKLGIARFTLVGTSSAGTPTAAYAAAHPERLDGLVLSNIAAGPIHLDVATLPEEFRKVLAEDATHPGWHRPEYWRQILLANVVDDRKVTPELVTRWTGLNHRMLRDPAVAGQVSAAMDHDRTPADLARITVPTLLLWSDQDHETKLETHGLKAFSALKTHDRTLAVVPECGHMMPLDCPTRSLERALPFFARVASK